MSLSSIPVAIRRRDRVLGWLAGDLPPPPTTEPAPAPPPPPINVTDRRITLRRRLFDDIGTMIFAHGLTPSPRAYGVLHAYVSGEDVHTRAAVARQLHGTDGLSDAVVMRIAEGHDEEQAVELARIAGALEARIADCLAAAGESRGGVETFGTALHAEAGRLSSDPQATLARVIGLTQAAVKASRLVEAKLHRAREEADALRQDLDRARRAAEHDHLTGLPNRRSFENRLRELVVDPDQRNAAVALLDIDDFKQVNDRFGHPAGDRVLKFVAAFLRSQLPIKVLVARYGGEEFALLFDGMAMDEAITILDGVRDRLSKRTLIHQDSGEGIGQVTFSAGVTPLGLGDPLAAADLALYAAKNSGKNRVARSAGA